MKLNYPDIPAEQASIVELPDGTWMIYDGQAHGVYKPRDPLGGTPITACTPVIPRCRDQRELWVALCGLLGGNHDDVIDTYRDTTTVVSIRAGIRDDGRLIIIGYHEQTIVAGDGCPPELALWQGRVNVLCAYRDSLEVEVERG